MAYFRSFLICICFALSAIAIAADMPAGDATRGKSLSQTCVACHGSDGKAIMPIYPNLAGQDQTYLYKSLQAFKQGGSGPRNNPIMAGMVANLSDQDMADLATYYSSQTAIRSQADPALVARGRLIYLGGVADDKVPACAACHGPQGEGNRFAAFPALSGQSADYTLQQLQAFREGQRTDPMMTSVSKDMSTEDMKAVSSYISGLH